MSVDRTALWILMALCACTGVVLALRAARRAGHDDDRPLSRLGRYGDALLTGLGGGLTVALVVLAVAALTAQLR